MKNIKERQPHDKAGITYNLSENYLVECNKMRPVFIFLQVSSSSLYNI
jgi:hypothetical protein